MWRHYLLSIYFSWITFTLTSTGDSKNLIISRSSIKSKEANSLNYMMQYFVSVVLPPLRSVELDDFIESASLTFTKFIKIKFTEVMEYTSLNWVWSFVFKKQSIVQTLVKTLVVLIIFLIHQWKKNWFHNFWDLEPLIYIM